MLSNSCISFASQVVNASNKLASGAPAINYDVGITITQNKDGSFSFELKSSTYYDLLFKKSLKRNGKILNLSGEKIGDKGVKHLVSSSYLARVEKVDLRYNEITAVGAKLLAVISPLPQLKSLILRHNILGDAGTTALAKSVVFQA